MPKGSTTKRKKQPLKVGKLTTRTKKLTKKDARKVKGGITLVEVLISDHVGKKPGAPK